MARMNPDQIYTKFLAEAREEDGNFYFVKLCDKELYDRLLKIERNAVINLEDSGSELRNALELFMRKALPEEYRSEVLDRSAMRKNRDYARRADIYDYQEFFEKHPELGVDTELFKRVRQAGNAFHHERAGRSGTTPLKTYETLCKGLSDLQKLLLTYYQKKKPAVFRDPGLCRHLKSYSRDRQPYGEKMVCSVIETLDSTACEKQILCSRQNERMPGQKQYYLLRVYSASNATEGAFRDEKVLSSLWENNLRGLPNIVRYSPLHVEYNGEAPEKEKKYIVAYDFGAFKPCPLHSKLLENLSDDQKLMIMHDIAAGVRVLHNAGIYHRNLQPGSVFVFFDKNSDFVQAKLVGFEYAKIDGDNATVFVNVAKRQREDPSAFFSMTMKQGLKNRQIGNRLDWSREDIYSLGALFCFILLGKPPQGIVTPAVLGGIKDDELKKLISSMLSPNIMDRPDIAAVMKIMEARCRTIPL